MNANRTFILSLCILFASASAVAQSADINEKQRLSQEKEAIEQRYQQAEAECKRRFVVTSCIKDASRQRTQELDPIRKRELAMREQERREQSDAQLRKLERRRAEAERRQSNTSTVQVAPSKPPSISLTQRQDHEMRHAEKMKSAENHRLKVEQAAKERRKPAAAGLPIPASSAAR
ncbi:MAG: hypothetical protein RLZZ271_407 [Pseudomonadota bacterium]|jgi:hypothetical protein